MTVAEVTTSVRGLAAEVTLDGDVGLEKPSVVNCDGLHTVAQSSLTTHVGRLSEEKMSEVCQALSYALGC